MSVFATITDSIGRTPLVRIHRLAARVGVDLLATLEGRHRVSSVKCRLGASP